MTTFDSIPAELEGATRLVADVGAGVDGPREHVADYGDPGAEGHALDAGAALASRSTRDLVTVEGPDTWTFLQSLVSADLDPLTDGEGVPALLLAPQGKLIAHFLVLRISATDAWLLVEAGHGADLLAALGRFRIRVQVELVDRTDRLGVISVLGPAARRAVAEWSAAEVAKDPGSNVAVGRVRFVSNPWPGVDAIDCIGRPDVLDGVWRALRGHGLVPVGHHVLEAARIRAGVPRLGIDVDDRTIPQEAFLERDAVSFTKGCFIGQELVCRIDTRGHVNRYLRVLTSDGDLRPGDEVAHDGKVVGAVSSAAPLTTGGTVALAMIRREVDPGAAVVAGGAAAMVHEAPPGG